MPPRARKSLHAHFVGLVLKVALVCTAVVAVAVYAFSVGRQRDEGLAVVRGVVSAFERTAAIGVYAKDGVLLGEVAGGIARHHLVRRVHVDDAQAVNLAHADGAAAKVAPAPRELGVPAIDLRLRSPFDAGEVIGGMRVWVDDEAITRIARQQALVLVAAVAVLMAVVVAAFNAVALRSLSRPMHGLARQLGAMKPGSGVRLSVDDAHGDDEIGTVVQAANSLLEAHERVIDQERTLRLEVAKMEAQYRQIFDTTSAGIIVIAPDGRLINSNRAVGRLLGADEAAMLQLRTTHFAEHVFCDLKRWNDTVRKARDSRATESADLEVRRLDGSRRWAHCLVSVQDPAADGEEALVEGVLYDVTLRRLAESQAARQAEIDPLTGLPNRRGFERILGAKIQDAREAAQALTMVFIDLDGFKSVNDTFGHDAGDRVLVECAKRLSATLRRKGDLVARLGGDELVVVLDRAAPSEAAVQDFARSVLRELCQPFLVAPGRAAAIGASIGIAGFPMHATEMGALVRAADDAMYRAKRGGKNSYRVADERETEAGPLRS